MVKVSIEFAAAVASAFGVAAVVFAAAVACVFGAAAVVFAAALACAFAAAKEEVAFVATHVVCSHQLYLAVLALDNTQMQAVLLMNLVQLVGS